MRTHVYVDGFNLYYGSLRGTPYRWLDLDAYCQRALPRNDVRLIRYFTARVGPRPHNPHQASRQRACLRALATIPHLEIHYGRFLSSVVSTRLAEPAPAAIVRVHKTEEKGSDVNLATYLLLDAFRGLIDAGVVISNDSDLAEPIQVVRKEFGIPVVVVQPCRARRRRSVMLQRVALKSFDVQDAWLQASQFPPTLTDRHGTITRPASW